MHYTLFIGRKISFAGDARHSSPAVRVATAAIALSVAVMLASIAIVTGFKHEIAEKVTGFNSDIAVTVLPSPEEDNIVRLSPTLQEAVSSVPGIEGAALQISMPAILKTADDFKGIYMKGVPDSATARFLRRNLIRGSLPDFSSPEGSSRIVISNRMASQLMLDTGDRIDTYFITDDVRVRPLKVAGIYDSHFDAYDDVLSFGSLDLIRKMALLDSNMGTVLQVTVSDFNNVRTVSADLRDALARSVATGRMNTLYEVNDAYVTGASYFRWLDLLDMNVIVILVLMIAVGCITLVSGMLIMILDKKRFIGLMKALGAPTSAVRKVFIYLAVRVTVRGLIIGNAIGLTLLWAQARWHFIPLDAEAYYIDFVPVSIDPVAVILLNAGVLVVVWLSLILPSRFVARISPAESMPSE